MKNRSRMRYAELRAEKLAIGSGVVEAANKTLVTARMKRSGMRAAHQFRAGDPGLPGLAEVRLPSVRWAIMMDKRGGAANNNFARENLAIAA